MNLVKLPWAEIILGLVFGGYLFMFMAIALFGTVAAWFGFIPIGAGIVLNLAWWKWIKPQINGGQSEEKGS